MIHSCCTRTILFRCIAEITDRNTTALCCALSPGFEFPKVGHRGRAEESRHSDGETVRKSLVDVVSVYVPSRRTYSFHSSLFSSIHPLTSTRERYLGIRVAIQYAL